MIRSAAIHLRDGSMRGDRFGIFSGKLRKIKDILQADAGLSGPGCPGGTMPVRSSEFQL